MSIGSLTGRFEVERSTDQHAAAGEAPDPSSSSAGRSATWVWALVGQSVSSATTLVLLILTGRTLGASALGVVAVGLGVYLVALSVQRSLITTPLISGTSSLTRAERSDATGAAFTATLAIATVGTLLLIVLGFSARGSTGQAMLVVAPWLAPTLAQDLLRTSLFRDGRGRMATLTDLVWLGTLLLGAPLAVAIGEIWPVVAAWGLGALLAACVGGVAMRQKPSYPSAARTWFFESAYSFGRWLLVQESVVVIGSFAVSLLLVQVLGTADVGGLRAADTTFGAMSLFAPALAVAGLPAVSRALSHSRGSALKLAVGISAMCVVLVLVYSGVMFFAGARILTFTFSEAFAPYAELVVPISLSQTALALGLGFTILLRGEQRGKALVFSGVAMTVIALTVIPAAAAAGGVSGAVWGYIAAAAVYSLLVIWFGIRGTRTLAGA